MTSRFEQSGSRSLKVRNSNVADTRLRGGSADLKSPVELVIDRDDGVETELRRRITHAIVEYPGHCTYYANETAARQRTVTDLSPVQASTIKGMQIPPCIQVRAVNILSFPGLHFALFCFYAALPCRPPYIVINRPEVCRFCARNCVHLWRPTLRQ